MTTWKATLPEENNEFISENGWSEDDKFPSGKRPIFRGELLVVGRVNWIVFFVFFADYASVILSHHRGTS